MKQLPGKARPKWLVVVGQAIAMVLFVAMTASILPVLLITSLVAALLLIPVLRQLRKELERTSVTINAPTREEMIDITPWHQRLRQEFLQLLRRGRP
jgi:membrane protein implicated in regulation of membrane protease activity